VLANENRGPLQWCGRYVVELLDSETIGTRRRGMPSDATSGGRGIEMAEPRAIQEMLVIGFAIPLMR